REAAGAVDKVGVVAETDGVAETGGGKGREMATLMECVQAAATSRPVGTVFPADKDPVLVLNRDKARRVRGKTRTSNPVSNRTRDLAEAERADED
ncbi:MAG: hypothetical protein AB1705_20580, partial [Verrucomicrobiota bacterium]